MSSRSSAATFCWGKGLVSCSSGLQQTIAIPPSHSGLPLEARAPRLTRKKVSRAAAVAAAAPQLSGSPAADSAPAAVAAGAGPSPLRLVGSRCAGTVVELCPKRGARMALGMGLEGWLPAAGDLGLSLGERLETLEVTEVQVPPEDTGKPHIFLRLIMATSWTAREKLARGQDVIDR